MKNSKIRQKLIRKSTVLIGGALLFLFYFSSSFAHEITSPLRISDTKRYFIDEEKKPVIIKGDTAWSLIAQLKNSEIEHYLEQRKAQGFNAFLVNLIEKKFSSNPPENAAGYSPFETQTDLSKPNEMYFSFADQVIKNAAKKGFYVFLVPAYLGYEGGEEGWYEALKANGRKKVRQYGIYLGQRYKNFPNIVWVLGGDYTPPWWYRWTVSEIAEGIREAGSKQLMTVHCYKESPGNTFGKYSWLDFNNIYTYEKRILSEIKAEYNREPIRPFVFLEGIYEGEHNVSAEHIRKQAYISFLSGAAGHFFGNNPVWNFSSPEKIVPTNKTWKESLSSRGAKDMSHLYKLYDSLKCSHLKPEEDLSVFLSPEYKISDEFLFSGTSDGKIKIGYIHSTLFKKLNIKKLKSDFEISLYDPTSGRWINDNMNLNGKIFHPQIKNGAGDNDWVLILKEK